MPLWISGKQPRCWTELSCAWPCASQWIQLGWAPLWTGLFWAAQLSSVWLVSLLTEWFVWGWRGCFLNSTGLQLPARVVTFILFFTAWFGSFYVCVAALCIGRIPWAFTVPAECNRIPSCHLCLPSHVGTVRVALATMTGQFITHYTFTLKHIHSG